MLTSALATRSDDLGELSKLGALNLRCKGLVSLPDSIGKLSNLRRLSSAAARRDQLAQQPERVRTACRARHLLLRAINGSTSERAPRVAESRHLNLTDATVVPQGLNLRSSLSIVGGGHLRGRAMNERRQQVVLDMAHATLCGKQPSGGPSTIDSACPSRGSTAGRRGGGRRGRSCGDVPREAQQQQCARLRGGRPAARRCARGGGCIKRRRRRLRRTQALKDAQSVSRRRGGGEEAQAEMTFYGVSSRDGCTG